MCWKTLRTTTPILVGAYLAVPLLYAQPDTLWTRIYEGGPGTARDGCLRVIPTFDGGYLLGGYRITGEEATDFSLVKVNSDFNQQWNETYRWEVHDIPYSVAQTADSNFVISGYSDVEGPTGVVAKVNSEGELVWTHFYGNPGSDLYDVIALPNGNIVVTGDSAQFGFLFEATANGEVLWQRAYQRGLFNRLNKTSDAGYIMVGQSAEAGNGVEGYVVSANAQGEEEWHNYYRGSDGGSFRSVVELEDGNFVFGGVTQNIHDGRHDFFLVRANADGDTIWQRQYHENFDCRLKDLITLPDGGLMFVGERFSDPRRNGNYVAYRLNADGDVVWNLYFGPVYAAVFYSVLLLDDNSYLFAGECDPFIGRHTEFWLVRTEPDTFNVNGVVLLDPAFPSLLALAPPYPNPFNASTTISFQIDKPSAAQILVFDSRGQQIDALISVRMFGPGNHAILWNATGVPAGEYFVRLETTGEVKTQKMTLVR
jgi:hypothetical protein